MTDENKTLQELAQEGKFPDPFAHNKKSTDRNRQDVAANTRRSRQALALLRQLAQETGYLDRGPYLSGLDEMIQELETGAARLTLKD